jgi:polar amino acid transport system substrate-binding protein
MQYSRRRFLGSSAAVAMLGMARPALGQKIEFKTVKPGIITVAMNGDMPMTNVVGGKLSGTDGEMINVVAKQLGLATEPLLMEWSATIQSILSRRADVMLGNMGWTPARAQAMLITDAVYYPGKFVLMTHDKPFGSAIAISEMKGYSLGTVTGFTTVPEIKKVPGTTDVKLYDTTDSCVRDVVAGRLDFAFLDAPTVAYLIQNNASWGLKQVPISFDPGFPIMTNKQHAVFGMSGENPDLFDAVNSGIHWLWKTKLNAQILAKYGVDSPTYFEPPTNNMRIGVDRTAEGGIIGPFAHTAKNYSTFFS